MTRQKQWHDLCLEAMSEKDVNKLLELFRELDAELNHHIRNALQVITFNNVPERSAEAIKQVDAAVSRIKWCLEKASPSAVQAALWDASSNS